MLQLVLIQVLAADRDVIEQVDYVVPIEVHQCLGHLIFLKATLNDDGEEEAEIRILNSSHNALIKLFELLDVALPHILLVGLVAMLFLLLGLYVFQLLH